MSGESGSHDSFTPRAFVPQFVAGLGFAAAFLVLAGYLVWVSSARASLLDALQYAGAGSISLVLSLVMASFFLRAPLSVRITPAHLLIRSTLGWRSYAWNSLATAGLVSLRTAPSSEVLAYKLFLVFAGRRVMLYQRAFDAVGWSGLVNAVEDICQRAGIPLSRGIVRHRIRLTGRQFAGTRKTFEVSHPPLARRLAAVAVCFVVSVGSYAAAIACRENHVLLAIAAIISALALVLVIWNVVTVIAVPIRLELTASGCRVKSLSRSFLLLWTGIQSASVESRGEGRHALRLAALDRELLVEDDCRTPLVRDEVAVEVDRYLRAAGKGLEWEPPPTGAR